MRKLRLAVVGVGNRGLHLCRTALGSGRDVEISALVDPSARARDRAGPLLSVPPDRRFEAHGDMLASRPKLDGVVIATDVRSHARVARDLMEAGVPIFLEKPMTRTIGEARELLALSRRLRAPVMVGMNLRYHGFYRRLKELVSAGKLGKLISIEWKEILSPAAWADGYCRSGWYSRKETVGGWLLEKSCHDIDQLNWLADARCERVASFGSRSLFVARDDVPTRCTAGCPIEPSCPYSCLKLHPDGTASLPWYVSGEDWDRCVYHSGSDLLDRQVAILEYGNGVTAAFSLLPSGCRWERVMRICGSEATIRGCDSNRELRLYPHGDSHPVVLDPPEEEGGHGGADPRIVDAFLGLLSDPKLPIESTIEVGFESMLAAGAVERSCEERQVVELGPLRGE